MNIKLIGAAAVSLLIATPAVAMQRAYHHGYRASPVHRARNFGYRSAYNAYGFYPGSGDFAPSNVYDDFARRNTFN
jgi:hypothetical protein